MNLTSTFKINAEVDLTNHASENEVADPIGIDTNQKGKTTNFLSIKADVDSLKVRVKP